jgi:hypothetical protein
MTTPRPAPTLVSLLLLSSLCASCNDPGPVVGPKASDEFGFGADACGVTPARGPGLSVGVIGDGNDVESFDGPAVVERNVPGDLVLTYAPATSGTLPRHATVYGLGDARPPLGAKLWLTLSPRPPFRSPVVTVRDKKAGRLLFAISDLESEGDAPLPAERSKTPGCSVRFSDDCSYGTRTHDILLVHGDQDVEIPDAQTRGVFLDDVEYLVRVDAQSVSGTDTGHCVHAGFSNQSATLQIWARDLAARVAALETGPPPACSRGNDEQKGAGFTLYNVVDGTTYDGPVVFKGVRTYSSSPGDTALEFEPTKLDGGEYKPVLSVYSSPGLFATPAIGATLWASVRRNAGALRTSEDGPFVFAYAYGAGDFIDAANRLSVVVGLGINAHQTCAWADGAMGQASTSYLYDFVFAATTPTTLPTDGHATLSFRGQDFDAWLSYGSAAVTLVARP